MRRLPLLVAVIAVALLAAACASSTGPGWTYAPPTEPPPSQPAASAAASAAPSEAPASAPASEAPSNGGGGGGDTVIQVSAMGIAFQQTDISAPADAPFTIHFNNMDAGIPHNIEIKDANGAQKFMGDIVTGPIEVDYKVPALPAGTYQFVCTVHPNMVGTLTVGG
jgi:plastocyanin